MTTRSMINESGTFAQFAQLLSTIQVARCTLRIIADSGADSESSFQRLALESKMKAK